MLAPVPAFAQPKQAPLVVGWLNAGSRNATGNRLAAFKQGMAELGWKENASYVLVEHWADARPERLDALARELAARKPAVIVAAPTGASAAAVKAAPRTPIVQATGAHPVAAGLASSFARPGGMVTGVTNVITDVSEKHVELLLAASPTLKRVGFLADPTGIVHAAAMKSAQRSADIHSIEARFEEARNPEQIETAIARLTKGGAQGLVMLPSTTIFFSERLRISQLALAQRWPMISNSAEIAEAGALLSYGPDAKALYHRAAWYVDRILKGAKPGDLPIEQPRKFELVVNKKTAKALGLTIPQSVLLQAYRVIE